MSESSYDCFAVVKAFGDLVIARSSLDRIHGTPPILLVGQHLLPLDTVLNARSAALTWQHDEAEVPALFDVRKCGARLAVSSAWGLRCGFRRLGIARSSRVWFAHDQLLWRELFITGGRAVPVSPHQKPGCEGNVYLAYDRCLTRLGFALDASEPLVTGDLCQAVVLPGARMAHRVVPPTVISKIASALGCQGIHTKAVLMDGESTPVPASIDVIHIPRRFDVLVETIKAASMVICADSLASHLGEYLGKPTFIATPAPKQYWLPRRAYLDDGWATFDDLRPLDAWLRRAGAAVDHHG